MAPDLTSDGERKAFADTVATAHIMLRNFRSGASAKLGTDGQTPCTRYKRPTYYKIAAFGHIGLDDDASRLQASDGTITAPWCPAVFSPALTVACWPATAADPPRPHGTCTAKGRERTTLRRRNVRSITEHDTRHGAYIEAGAKPVLGTQFRVYIPTIEGLRNAIGSQPSARLEPTFGPFPRIVKFALGRTAAACNETWEGVTAGRLTDRVVA